MAVLSRTSGPGPSGVTRSLRAARWIWREGGGARRLRHRQRLGVPDIVGRLLAARGIEIEAAADFLEPTLRALLPDPSMLIDMDVAAARLADAVARGETVAVFGDYDVDGACSAALMVSLLRDAGLHRCIPTCPTGCWRATARTRRRCWAWSRAAPR